MMLEPVMRGILDPAPPTVDLAPFISALFASGRMLAWYDPSDLTTLFQDPAGTTPVTTSGQPVGLIRDKSGRNNHASQPVAASKPIYTQDADGRRYLAPDGIDDGMFTGSINMTGYSRIGGCAGVFRASGSGTAVIFEFSPSTTSNNGSFGMLGAASFATFRSKGTATVSTATSGLAVAPSSNVFTGYASIIDDITQMTSNGWATGSMTSDQGAGPYGTYALNLFRRNNASLPLFGSCYGVIVLADPTPDELILMTAYMNQKTGAY